jgi:hypothetical protein
VDSPKPSRLILIGDQPAQLEPKSFDGGPNISSAIRPAMNESSQNDFAAQA